MKPEEVEDAPEDLSDRHSQGVCLPKAVLEPMGLAVGSVVEVEVAAFIQRYRPALEAPWPIGANRRVAWLLDTRNRAPRGWSGRR